VFVLLMRYGFCTFNQILVLSKAAIGDERSVAKTADAAVTLVLLVPPFPLDDHEFIILQHPLFRP